MSLCANPLRAESLSSPACKPRWSSKARELLSLVCASWAGASDVYFGLLAPQEGTSVAVISLLLVSAPPTHHTVAFSLYPEL